MANREQLCSRQGRNAGRKQRTGAATAAGMEWYDIIDGILEH